MLTRPTEIHPHVFVFAARALGGFRELICVKFAVWLEHALAMLEAIARRGSRALISTSTLYAEACAPTRIHLC